MVETVYNDRGEIIKTKERRLFLLNDVLMCATANIRYERHIHFGIHESRSFPLMRNKDGDWVYCLLMSG